MLRTGSSTVGVSVTGLLLMAAMCLHAQGAAMVPGGRQPSSKDFVLHTGTSLVIIDVVVHGHDGRPIHNLKASDFSIAENGMPQHISNFAEHVRPEKVAVANTAQTPSLPPGLFTNFTPAPSTGPSNVLLLDMLNTPLQDQEHARIQIQEYLDHAPVGTSMAIFGLSNNLIMLQGFTSNPAILKAILSHKNAIKGSSLLTDPNGSGAIRNNANVSDALAQLGNTPDVLEAIDNARQFEADSQSFQLQIRARMTLDALNGLAKYLAAIPGRKNVLWFSGSFPLTVLADPSINNGFGTMASSEEEFRQTANLLAHEEIVLYPINVRGVMNSNVFNAAASSSKYARDSTAPGKDIAKFDMQTAQENGTMEEAAEDTGGRAFLNTNALSQAVGSAIEDGSNYYTLTYSSSDRRTDGSYRRIMISAPDKNDTLEYRRGYYAEDANSKIGEASAETAISIAASSPISRSLMRGAPSSTQIIFRMRIRPATGALESSTAAGNELNQQNAEATGPFTRFAIDLVLDPHDFFFTQKDGISHDAIQFITFVYDRDGNLVNRAGNTVHTDFGTSTYAAFLARPFAFSQDISVPHKGDYFLRVAVQDLNNGRIGTIEVPVESVKNLEPLAKENIVSHP